MQISQGKHLPQCVSPGLADLDIVEILNRGHFQFVGLVGL
jgi:hypothetical protein